MGVADACLYAGLTGGDKIRDVFKMDGKAGHGRYSPTFIGYLSVAPNRK